MENMEFRLIFSIVQRIDLFAGDEDNVVIAFDLDSDIGESINSSKCLGEIEAGEMFNDLCREVYIPSQLPQENILMFFHGHQTFLAACKAHYDSKSIFPLIHLYYYLTANSGGELEREDHEDMPLNTYDLPANRFEEVDQPASQPSGSQVNELVAEAPAPRAPARTTSEPKSLAQASRRELIWRPGEGNAPCLDYISQQFRSFAEDMIPTSSHPPLRRRQAHSAPKTPHRCSGYNLEEITLTPDISESTIVSYLTPMPGEICSLCGEVVGQAESFRCICNTGGG
jgi:hypothetical protein